MSFKLKLSTIRLSAFSLILLIIGSALGYNLALNGLKLGNIRIAEAKIANSNPPESVGSVDFSLFWEVWNRLQDTYIDADKLDSQKMVYGAIQGMTQAVGDPYTIFLPPNENEQSKADLNGQFEGVGIQLGYIEGQLGVMSPLEGMPAIKAGVKAGDMIVHIKDSAKKYDKDTTGMNLVEAVDIIRGPKGTPITLTLFRKERGSFDVTLNRDTIVIPSVEVKFGDIEGEKWHEKDNGQVAWLRVYRFGDKTQAQWDEAVRQIQAKNPASGIVFDLRNNPGGYLQGSIDLASEFIKDGVVVKQQGRDDTQTYNVSRRGRLIDTPIVVLINKGSASASEILAGALRDRLGVKLVGEKSFGKGTVQDALDVRNKAGLHVTIARWLLPNGDWIHEAGLKPDIEVNIPEASASGLTTSPSPSSETLEESDDIQLIKAIETLKNSQ